MRENLTAQICLIGLDARKFSCAKISTFTVSALTGCRGGLVLTLTVSVISPYLVTTGTVLHVLRDWSLITGRGGLQNGRGGIRSFTPTKRGEREKL